MPNAVLMPAAPHQDSRRRGFTSGDWPPIGSGRVTRTGCRFRLPIGDWSAAAIPGDAGLVARCCGPTLDIGCGPGRLVAALANGGIDSLGIDISAGAVARARKLGAKALRCSVFGPCRGQAAGRARCWPTATSGSAVTRRVLLRRVRGLLAPGGRVLVEVAAPEVATTATRAATRGRVRRSLRSFSLGRSRRRRRCIRLARDSALAVADRWNCSGRWFVELRKT